MREQCVMLLAGRRITIIVADLIALAKNRERAIERGSICMERLREEC